MSIGEKLKELREAAGYNKKEAAEKLEMPYTTYNNYETDARDVGSETLREIARFYDVTIDYILENDVHFEHTTDEFSEYLNELRKRPEMKVLFKAAKGATKEEIEKTAKILGILKGNS